MIAALPAASILSTGLCEPSHAQSTDGIALCEQISKTAAHFHRSWTFGESRRVAIESLSDLARECLQPGWDGYDAPALKPETFRVAHRFIRSMPPEIPPPEIGASSAGDITFEWAQSPFRLVSVGVSANGELHFASLNGNRRCFGSMPFDGTFDEQLFRLVEEALS